jgi:phage replication O-like protein O
MADVQLEHGHLRIANALDEAITFADFTGTQTKIVRCLVRLTFGWRRRTVRIALPDIAERCHVAPSGGFRRALDELIREGVVVELERSIGRVPSLYQVNKDYESWGKFSVAAKALESLYGERPAHGDDAAKVPPQGQATENDENSCMPPQGEMHDPTGEDSCPHEGTKNEPKSLIGETVGPPKDSEIQERQIISIESARAKIERSALPDDVRLVTAANQGLAEHPARPQRIPRILTSQSGTYHTLEMLRAAHVPIDFAESTIYDLAKVHPADDEVSSLKYFLTATIRAWDKRTSSEQAAQTPRPPRIQKQAPQTFDHSTTPIVDPKRVAW